MAICCAIAADVGSFGTLPAEQFVAGRLEGVLIDVVSMTCHVVAAQVATILAKRKMKRGKMNRAGSLKAL